MSFRVSKKLVSGAALTASLLAAGAAAAGGTAPPALTPPEQAALPPEQALTPPAQKEALPPAQALTPPTEKAPVPSQPFAPKEAVPSQQLAPKEAVPAQPFAPKEVGPAPQLAPPLQKQPLPPPPFASKLQKQPVPAEQLAPAQLAPAQLAPAQVGAVAEGRGPFISLSAAEISGALTASNNAEIQASVIALTHSFNPVVIAYAQRMIQDHDLANREMLQVGASTGLAAQASTVSQQLELDSLIQNGVLLQLFGPAFDVVYMDGQVRAHQQALRLVEGTLGPMATFPAFAGLLNHARGMIAQHLDLAIKIRGPATL
jgi:predicted outer membrane protein